MDSNSKKLRLTAKIVFDWHDDTLEWQKETRAAVEDIEKRKQLATLEDDFEY